MAEVEIRLLGPFELLVDGRVVDLPAQPLRAVLAGLALRPWEVIGFDSLASLAWQDAEVQPDVRATLQACVVCLRAVIGQELIKAVGGGYLLEIDRDQVDVLRFARLAGLRIEDRDTAVRVLALWRGTPFTGVDSPLLLESAAPPLVEARLAVIERLTDLDIAAERHGDGLAELEELAETYPLRESLWARLIVVLARKGRRTDALDRYEQIRRRIAHERGVGPGPQLRLIHSELLRADVPDTLSAAAHRSVPGNLPPGDLTFTGRADELTRLDKALEEGVATVVIHGPGGAGKTALAIRWAHQVVASFPDGHFYFTFRQYGTGHRISAEEATEIILCGLGLQNAQLPAGFNGRTALLRSTLAASRTLLVLDDVVDVDQVRPLLPEISSLAVVISRRPLRALLVGDSKSWLHLDCLSLGDSLGVLRRSVPPVMELPNSMMTELADQCDRLPLALVIAAEQIAGATDEWRRRFLLGLRGEQTRLDSVEAREDISTSTCAVVSTSYGALDAETGRLFRLLGLHPGVPFSQAAAAALAGIQVDEAETSLSWLVKAQLVQEVRAGRYKLHDLVRTFAMKEAAATEPPIHRTAAVLRLLSWYVHTAESARRVITASDAATLMDGPAVEVCPLTFDNERQASDWFESEYATLVAVVLEALANDDQGLASALVERMHTYLHLRRSPIDSLELREAAMKAAVLKGDVRAGAATSASVGALFGRTGHPYSARRFGHSPAARRNSEAIATEAVALGNIAAAEWISGRWLDVLVRPRRAP